MFKNEIVQNLITNGTYFGIMSMIVILAINAVSKSETIQNLIEKGTYLCIIGIVVIDVMSIIA